MPDDTLSEELLPAPDAPDGKGEGEDQTSQTPVSRAEFEMVTKSLLDLTKKLDQGLRANRQSAQDTIKSAVSAAQKTSQDFLLDRLAGYLPKDGPSLEDLRRDAYLDEQMAKTSAPSEEQGPKPDEPAPAGPSLIQQEIKTILDETGLKGTEPELREFVAANKGKPWFEAGPAFADLARKIAARKRGSAGSVMPGKGKVTSSSRLEDEYRNEVQARLQAGDVGLHVLRTVRDKYRQAGLENVEEIDISDLRWRKPVK